MIRNQRLIAVPPGATIEEQLQDRGISVSEFARQMDMPENQTQKLISGDIALTYDIAIRLEAVLGVPAKFWNNLEAGYLEKIKQINKTGSPFVILSDGTALVKTVK